MVQANSLKNKAKQKIIIISGPTAVGKTDIALKLAVETNAEIIGADSMQIYKRLNFGTGKIMPGQMLGIKHHLIDIKEPYENYSVGEFVCDCKNCINDIVGRGKVPIIAGGTGLYINALINGYSLCSVPKSDKLREELKKRAEINGTENLYSELKKIDPNSAAKIMPNDLKRIIRALEIYYASGKTKTENETRSTESEYDYLLFILEKDREKLYMDIDCRVEKMFACGIIDEVKTLIDYKDCQSMQAIGYKEIVAAMENGKNPQEALSIVQRNSRRYAKRQMTYFRSMNAKKTIVEFDDFNAIYQKTINFLSNMSDTVQ